MAQRSVSTLEEVESSVRDTVVYPIGGDFFA